MTDLRKLVEEKLASDDASGSLVQMWSNIFQWYEEGGPDNVESNLTKRLKEISATVSKSIKDISPEIKRPKKKGKRRRK